MHPLALTSWSCDLRNSIKKKEKEERQTLPKQLTSSTTREKKRKRRRRPRRGFFNAVRILKESQQEMRLRVKTTKQWSCAGEKEWGFIIISRCVPINLSLIFSVHPLFCQSSCVALTGSPSSWGGSVWVHVLPEFRQKPPLLPVLHEGEGNFPQHLLPEEQGLDGKLSPVREMRQTYCWYGKWLPAATAVTANDFSLPPYAESN